jgi:hypothetical protein
MSNISKANIKTKLSREGRLLLHKSVAITRQGEWIVLTGPTGTHKLDYNASSGARIMAHVKGFVGEKAND